MTSGDFLGEENFPSCSPKNVFLYFMYTFFCAFFCYFPPLYVSPSNTQSSRYIVFSFLSGDIKSIFLIYLKKFSFLLSYFLNINDDYTERKKLFYAWFFSPSLPKLRLIFLSVCTPRLERTARLIYRGSLRRIPYSPSTKKKNLNKWFLIYVLRVLN